MRINLLAGSAIGLFIGLLVIMIIVVLLFGFLIFLLFRQSRQPSDYSDASNVKKLLAQRETQLTVEVMNVKDDEAKKTELVHKLRRVKSAQLLVDELLAEEKALNGAAEETQKKRLDKKAPAPKPEGEKPAKNAEGKPDGKTEEKTEKKVAPSEQPVVKANVKPNKPEKKKKDDMEFNPSEE